MLLIIIIPCYNASGYLHRCLDSILNQPFENLEIIVIEDFSGDNSLDIKLYYEKKDARIKPFRNKINIGQGATRNKGIKIARGEEKKMGV